MKEKDSKVIFSPQLASFLVNKGFRIIKLKPRHDNPEMSVFVFLIQNGFFEAIESFKKMK